MLPKRVLVVTNVLTSYRKPLYERLARELPARFVFYSDGQEWYWRGGSLDPGLLPAVTLPGHWILGTRVTPSLVAEVWRADHDVIIKDINGRFSLPVSYAIARLRHQRFVLWTGLWHHPSSRFHRLSRPLVKELYRRADAVVTYGRHVSAHVIREGADPQHVVEAPQAVDLELFSPSDGTETPGPPLVLYVGRLEPWKGPQILVESLISLGEKGKRFRARFIGSGSLEATLRERVISAGLGDIVEFPGALAPQSLPPHYREAAVTVVPSIETNEFTEPWSLAVNEALGCGSLVLATTSVGAVADGLISHGLTGVVAPQGSVVALTEALGPILDNPTAFDRIRVAGSRAVREYSYAAAVKGFERAVEIARSR